MTQIIHVARDGSGDYTSLKAAIAAINGPYEIRLKSGDDFTSEGHFTLESNGKLTIYGGNERPKVHKLNTLNEGRDIFSNVVIYGIEFLHGVRLVGGNTNVLIDDCKLERSELTVQHYAGVGPKNIKIRRTIFTGAFVKSSSYHRNSRPSNLFAAGVDGLEIEECAFDMGGWHATETGAGANMFNHNLYIQYSCKYNTVSVRRCIITRASSHGIHGRPGGVFEDNFFAKNAISLQMGYKSHPLPAGAKGIARRNVVTECRSMVKGHDSGAGDGLVTAARWGLHIDRNPGQGEYIYEGNRIHWDQDNETNWRQKFGSLISRTQLLHKDAKISKNDTVVVENGRTLEDYAKFLGIEGGFDGFMQRVLNRKVGEWDSRFTAEAINAFVSEGQTVVVQPAPVPAPAPVKELPPEVAPAPVQTSAPTPTTVIHELKGETMEIQAELFTHYHDTTAENQGNTGEPGPVDTVQQGDVTYVGWTYAGEYLEYALDVPAASLYDLALIAGTGRKEPQPMAVAIDGVDVGTINVAPGSWTTFSKSEALRIGLSAGKHTIRLTFVTGGVNIDKMELVPVETVREVVKEVVREVIPASAVEVVVDGKKMAIVGL